MIQITKTFTIKIRVIGAQAIQYNRSGLFGKIKALLSSEESSRKVVEADIERTLSKDLSEHMAGMLKVSISDRLLESNITAEVWVE